MQFDMKCFSITGHFVQSLLLLSLHLCEEHKGFFLGCRRKRQTLRVRLCTNKLHDDRLSKRQIVQTKHANLNLFVSQRVRGHSWKQQQARRRNNQSPSRVSSQEIVLLFSIKLALYSPAWRQLSLIFFNISRGVKELFPVLLHQTRIVSGGGNWFENCVVYCSKKNTHTVERGPGSRDVLWAQVRLESVMKCSALGNIGKIDW